MTFSWKLRSRFNVKCGMSSFQATRRASARSSSVQQPPYVDSAADRLSYICIDRPTTSWPAALRMYAAVEESTPPDIATAIFMSKDLEAFASARYSERHRMCTPSSEWSRQTQSQQSRYRYW